MNPSRCAFLLEALADPASMAGFDGPTWDLVARQAQAAGLLARLAVLARGAGVEPAIAAPVRRRMQAMLTIAEQQHRAVRWELTQLTRTLAELPGPALLLKGAAYAAGGLAPGHGRLFADIDLMVPKAQLGAGEAALMLGGWYISRRNAYDQRYYRKWMHELPPMTQMRRGTVLDLHHRLLPETARLRTEPDLIFESARPLPAFPRFCLPCDTDLVLHSATHLFHEGEWQRGLRDLVDIDALLRDFGRDRHFWDRLALRARDLNLERPLFYALRYASRLLATPVPAQVLARSVGRPGPIRLRWMDALFVSALLAVHPTCRTPLTAVAEWMLFVRSHWLRMPLRLLLPHLAYKFWQPRWERLSHTWTDRTQRRQP